MLLSTAEFLGKIPFGQKWPQNRVFLYFEKFCHWSLLETYLNKNWYCSEFDRGRDAGFTTRFWISKTELFVIMNVFTIAERNKDQWIYQWICDIQIIWKLSYLNLLRIIVFELFEHWTMYIVFLFLVLILYIWLTIKPNNFRKFYSRISEKYDQISIFAWGVL